jgi:hypothetical protein
VNPLLDAFDASVMSGKAFAKHHGINYQTFASWVQKRRRSRGDDALRKCVGEQTLSDTPKIALTLAEVTVTPLLKNEISPSASPLKLTLSCGLSVKISDRAQLPLLLQLLTTLTSRASC